jgi:lipopolysaccharide export LptBFGC system permease protein LptF
MEIVLQIKTDKYETMKNKLMKDDLVSRASITFKEAKSIDESKEGYYCYISGTDDQCKRTLVMIKAKNPKTGEELIYAEEVSGKEKDKVIEKIKEEQDKASEAFGDIFG